jgi:hypothetical protein
MSVSVELSAIRIDGGTQPRELIDPVTVEEYAEAMRQLAPFPPLIVFHDGVHTWLADGFHRYHAAQKIGAQAAEVDWRIGTLEKAKLFAASANTAHGLRRTEGDKRRAIEMVLSTTEGRRWTQERIAEHCDVDQSYVSRLKAKYDSHNRTKNRTPPSLTKAEQKRARIADAATARPEASNRAIARELGVHRETVAAVRAKQKATTATSPPAARDAQAPSNTPERPTGGFSTADAYTAASSVLDTARAVRAVFTEADWKLLLTKLEEEALC